MKQRTRVGLISDTHGLLRPQALAFLRGCDAIIHGGDIGDAEILHTLARLAPVTAVRGNNDVGAWAENIPENQRVTFSGVCCHAIHDLTQLEDDPTMASVRAVVSGHSHKPKIETRAGVLYINPGSAGPRRFTLPVAAGELWIDGDTIHARVVDLLDGGFAALVST